MSESTKSTEDWVKTQQKVFTRFMNVHLNKRGQQLQENGLLAGDLDNGLALWHLVEIISGKNLPKINLNPKFKIQQIENLSKVLDFLHHEGLTLVGIGAEDILDKNEKLILGLSWQIIWNYQIKPQKEKAELAKKRKAELAKKKKEELRSQRRKAREEQKKRKLKAQETLKRAKQPLSPPSAEAAEESAAVATAAATEEAAAVKEEDEAAAEAPPATTSIPPETPVDDAAAIAEAEAVLRDDADVADSDEEEEEGDEAKVAEKSPQAEFVDWLVSVGVNVQNLTTDFQDGKNLCKLVNLFSPDLISPSQITDNRIETAALGIATAYKELGIPTLIDATDLVESPNTLVNMTYLSYFRGKYLQHLEDAETLAHTPPHIPVPPQSPPSEVPTPPVVLTPIVTKDESVPQPTSAGTDKDVSVPHTTSPGTGKDVSVPLTTSTGTGKDASVPLTTSAGTGKDASVPLTTSTGTGNDASVPLTTSPGTGKDVSVPLTTSTGTGKDVSVPQSKGTGTGSDTSTGTSTGMVSVVPPLKDLVDLGNDEKSPDSVLRKKHVPRSPSQKKP